MVQTAPGLPASDIRQADEVLHMRNGATFDEADTAGDELVGGDDITPGQDVTILGMIVDIQANGEETQDVGNATGQNTLASAGRVLQQIGTRTEFAEKAADDEIPAGVMFHDSLSVVPPTFFEDETNQVGGIGGGTGFVERIGLTQDAIRVLSTVDIDEGTSIQTFYRLESVPGGGIQVFTDVYLFVQEG